MTDGQRKYLNRNLPRGESVDVPQGTEMMWIKPWNPGDY
jgi:hypothetical protein